MMKQEEIICRVQCTAGRFRININPMATLQELKVKIKEVSNILPADQKIRVGNERASNLAAPDTKKLRELPDFVDGVQLFVDGAVQKHSPEKHVKSQPVTLSGKAVDPNTIKFDKVETHSKCSHGPGGKCLNCMKPEESKDTGLKPKGQTWLCQHGPNGKCPHCMDQETMTDAKHMSFDQFLMEKSGKCKEHPPEAKCNNCLPPSAISYKMNMQCKNHLPWPKAMCNKCMPPSVIVKRQDYRHVDYAEFTNQQEIGNFVNYWLETGRITQRVGFLYGYYCEDPVYKNGVRCIIEAIYEPPQKNDMNTFEILQDEQQNTVDYIAQALGFEKVGWIFTTLDSENFLDSNSVRMAARLQEQHVSLHPSGYKVSKFVTVVIRMKSDGTGDIVPDVYMISDQGQAIERDGILDDSDKRKFLKVRKPKEGEIISSVVAQGKSQDYVEPDFFLVNIAHGAPKNNTYATMKHSDFPVENRPKAQATGDLKNYLTKFAKQPSQVKFADFHLLAYLAKILDLHTAGYIAQCVREEKPVSEDTEMLIKSII